MRTEIKQTRLYTLNEVGDMLGISYYKIRQLVRLREIQAGRFGPGGNWFITGAALQAYLDKASARC